MVCCEDLSFCWDDLITDVASSTYVDKWRRASATAQSSTEITKQLFYLQYSVGQLRQQAAAVRSTLAVFLGDLESELFGRTVAFSLLCHTPCSAEFWTFHNNSKFITATVLTFEVCELQNNPKLRWRYVYQNSSLLL